MHDFVKVPSGGSSVDGNRQFFTPCSFFTPPPNSEALSSAPGSAFQSVTVTVDRFCSLPGLLSQTDDLKGLVGVWVYVVVVLVVGGSPMNKTLKANI